MLSAVIVSVLLLLSCSAYTAGDVDGNGKVTAADARLTLRASAYLETLTNEQAVAADVDGNGKVNAADARKILRAASKIEDITEATNVTTTKNSVSVTVSGKDDNTIPTVAEIDKNTVYITPTGKKFHKSDCRTLKDSVAPVKRETAIDYGYDACKVCKP